jgi:hypothetical protein
MSPPQSPNIFPNTDATPTHVIREISPPLLHPFCWMKNCSHQPYESSASSLLTGTISHHAKPYHISFLGDVPRRPWSLTQANRWCGSGTLLPQRSLITIAKREKPVAPPAPTPPETFALAPKNSQQSNPAKRRPPPPSSPMMRVRVRQRACFGKSPLHIAVVRLSISTPQIFCASPRTTRPQETVILYLQLACGPPCAIINPRAEFIPRRLDGC